MMATAFQVGDLVWAKMKGFPPWPGKVSTPPENKRVSDKKPRCYIFFFGSENFAWVTNDNVWPYLENREKYMTLSRPSNSFQEAVDAMDNYIRENGGTVPEKPEKSRSPSPTSNQNDESLRLSSTKRSRNRVSLTPGGQQQPKVKGKEEERGEGEGKEATVEEEAEGEDGEKPAKAGKMKEADVEVKARKTSRRGKGKNEKPEGEGTMVVGDSEKGDEEKEEKMEVDSEEAGGGDAVVGDEVSEEKKPDDEEKKPNDEDKEKKDGNKDNHDTSKKDPKELEGKKPVAPRASKRTSAVLKTDDSQKQTPSSSRSSKKAAYLPDVLPSATSAVTPSCSDIARLKTDVVPTTKKIGFLGVGEIGEALIGCLLATGHQVTVWNRTISKCKELLKKGASKGSCPSDVVGKCDLTFACLSDAAALKDVVFGNGGVLQAITDGKGFINLSTVDVETTMDVCEAISSRGGRFLEAPIIGSREMSKTGQLLLLTSGEQSLFDECSSCFKSIAKNVFNLVDLGMASKMQIVLNALYGTTLAGLAESLSLASKIGLDPSEVLEVLGHSSANSTLIREKGSDMVKNRIMDASCRLTTLQRDLRLAINMSEVVDQPLHVGSAVNELFKKAKAKGYGDADISAIYRAADL